MNANAFSKCLPAISTNISQCGTVTQCDAKPLTLDELDTTYLKSGDFRVMESLLYHDIEIRMCETTRNGLYEFLMANRVNLSKRISSRRVNSGLIEIAPFILARQYSPINNDYWEVSAGSASVKPDALLDAGDLYCSVASVTNIPADVRSFPVGMRVYIDGTNAGGVSTKTAWRVIEAIAGTGVINLSLASENANSNLDSDKLTVPVTGLLRRGTPNVNGYEKWCAEQPAYLNWKNVPFWVEETRTSLCKSSLYDKWKKLVTEGNPLYREFFDLDEISKNRQLSADWQKRWVNSVFWNKALPKQNMTEYDELETIETFPSAAEVTAGEDTHGLGVDNYSVNGGYTKCVGKRANTVGIYEQLAECGRVFDALGEALNLGALFREIYNMMRVRESNGRPSEQFDLFTDSVTAEAINRAMIGYYDNKSGGMLRLTMPVNSEVKTARFGFNYRSYKLFWPNVTINVITHYFFDDYLNAAATVSAAQETTARVLWILDFAGIYPGILASNRVVHKTGDLQTLAAVNPDFACVMKVPTQEQTLISLTYTVIVECPASNLIIENFSSAVPDYVDDAAIDYSTGSTVTTTTTAG